MEEIRLFPLNSVVLPEGKMKLRIFEPRYVRMVKECTAQGVGFGICLSDSSSTTYPLSYVGTYARIIDFEQMPDGLLGITVEGEKRFLRKTERQEPDGLRIASVDWLENWQTSSQPPSEKMVSMLRAVHDQFPELGELYAEGEWQDRNWVLQRWIEILPITIEQFDRLLKSAAIDYAEQFVDSAIEQILVSKL